jgi:hypothetical protein
VYLCLIFHPLPAVLTPFIRLYWYPFAEYFWNEYQKFFLSVLFGPADRTSPGGPTPGTTRMADYDVETRGRLGWICGACTKMDGMDGGYSFSLRAPCGSPRPGFSSTREIEPSNLCDGAVERLPRLKVTELGGWFSKLLYFSPPRRHAHL